MAAPPTTRGAPVETRDDLVLYLEEGCKPREAWGIGTEHEKFVFRRTDLRPVPYEGPDGIGALLEGVARFGWTRVQENGRTIALQRGRASITLEPAGQFELSGAPVRTLHESALEVDGHLEESLAVGDALGLGFLGVGFNPKWGREDMPWMPKGRYGIMRSYMPTRGALGLDMMTRTCTVQTNLDFASEADMARKFRASLALQPIATALFASSPFTEGRPNGYQSYRSHIWTDTDPDRCGMLPFVFDEGFGFERYVDHVLDVPMYFVYRDGRYIDASGQSFRDFLEGRLPALPGEKPLITDWADHLTTLFPEVRMKRFLEMRGADVGPRSYLVALPALWVGLLYDEVSLQASLDLVRDWSLEDLEALRRDVPRLALGASVAGRRVQDVARDVVAIARDGLARRRRRDDLGRDEVGYLDPLVEIAESGRTLATEMLEKFAGEWRGSVDPVFREYAF